MSVNGQKPLETFVRMLVYMAIFGALLAVAGILGAAFGIISAGAAVAIATPGAIALAIGLWEHRRFSHRLSRLRDQQR